MVRQALPRLPGDPCLRTPGRGRACGGPAGHLEGDAHGRDLPGRTGRLGDGAVLQPPLPAFRVRVLEWIGPVSPETFGYRAPRSCRRDILCSSRLVSTMSWPPLLAPSARTGARARGGKRHGIFAFDLAGGRGARREARRTVWPSSLGRLDHSVTAYSLLSQLPK